MKLTFALVLSFFGRKRHLVHRDAEGQHEEELNLHLPVSPRPRRHRSVICTVNLVLPTGYARSTACTLRVCRVCAHVSFVVVFFPEFVTASGVVWLVIFLTLRCNERLRKSTMLWTILSCSILQKLSTPNVWLPVLRNVLFLNPRNSNKKGLKDCGWTDGRNGRGTFHAKSCSTPISRPNHFARRASYS